MNELWLRTIQSITSRRRRTDNDYHAAAAAGEEAIIVAVAQAKGISANALVREAVNRLLNEALAGNCGMPEPTLPVRGILAKYGPAPSLQEIDQNRAGMFANFPRDDF